MEKEGQVESWNDDRLNELSQAMKEGFAKSDRETKEGFARVDRQFEKADREAFRRFDAVDRRFGKVDHELHRVHDQLDRFVYAQVFFAVSITAAVLANGIFS